jgi:alpha/beta hydrolase family protein
MKHPFLLLSALVLAAVTAVTARAEVTKVDVAKRTAIGTSGYEKVVGTVHFAIDPKDPRNKVIADLDKAPVNAQGKVEFSSDFYLIRPVDPARSNGVALVEVSNRGRKGSLGLFSRAPSTLDPQTDADLGDGFLTRDGFTLAWVGWQFDVKPEGGLMSFNAPVATNASLVVRAEFTPNDRGPSMTVADLAGYPPADAAGPDTRLTVRVDQFGAAQTIDRSKYTVSGNVVTMRDGFDAGRIYEISYKTANPAIAGAGMAAFRDFAAWLKHGQQGNANAKYAYAWGSSQSGRFLRTFLYYGFNADEKGGQVFDGVMAHIAGAARLSLNERSATPNALSMFTATGFPYANVATRDPISGRTEGLLDNERARQHQPKIFYTNTAVEYWGGGRSAALIHTSADGKSDLTLPDNERVYFLTGSQHGPARFPTRATQGQQPENPVEYAWTMRALFAAMDGWIRNGKQPPASQYPRIADGTLVPVAQVGFPAIPGVASPKTIPAARQNDRPIPLLVPQVDADGNELAGVRTPEITVPMATYTGWNFRSSSIGGTNLLVSLMGSAIPFAPTKAARASGDPRRSVEERYASQAAYTAAVQAAADKLVASGYLREDDVPQVLKRAGEQWSTATSGARTQTTASRQ